MHALTVEVGGIGAADIAAEFSKLLSHVPRRQASDRGRAQFAIAFATYAVTGGAHRAEGDR